MKAAVILSFYNKQYCNRNTVYSVLRQFTDFPFEILIINDNSPTDDFSYLKGVKLQDNITLKYRKNKTNKGSNFGHQTAMEMMSDDVDIVVTQSSDVMYAHQNALQKLVEGVDDTHYASGTVANLKVDTDLWKTMRDDLPKIVQNRWPKSKNPKTKEMYVSRTNPRYFWFLAAIKRDHLRNYFTWWDNACDVKTKDELQKLEKEGKLYRRFVDQAMGIHQSHPSKVHPCPILDTCPYSCVRKRK